MTRSASPLAPAVRSQPVTSGKTVSGARNAIVLACFFLSGFAGLVHEVCWIRRASLEFGSTTFALSTVLAVFFLGLALGSRWFGGMSPRIRSPLRLYAAVEIGVGVLALATLPEFDLASRLYGHVYRSFAGQPLVHGALRFGLVALILVPPTLLMGGTLPLFCRRFTTERSRIAGSVGLLYGLNTLGAAAGCAATGLVLLPALGMRMSIVLGAALNVVAGVVVALVARGTESAAASTRTDVVEGHEAKAAAPPRDRSKTAVSRQAPRPVPDVMVLFLVFVAGFVALGYEVVWPRYLSLLVPNDIHRYTFTLTFVLLGIVLGSFAASRLFDRVQSRGAVFGAIQVLFGLLVLGVTMIPPSVWNGIGNDLAIFALLLLPPAILSGALFPLAVRMVVRDPEATGLGVGRVTAFNTLGGILGSLGIGFLALPGLGLQPSLLFLTGTSVLAGAVAWALYAAGSRSGNVLIAAAAALVWLAVPRVARTRVPADFLPGEGILVDYREGLESNLAVVRRDERLVLEIDRWWQGQDGKTHQVMAAHLPMILHHRPRRVLVVGAGAGQTASRILMHDVEHLDCVDIEPAVFDLIRPHFDSAWMGDPRVTLLREDGRNVLAHSGARWDVISLEVGQVFRPGIAAFYTTDFYRRARARLEPGGLLCQFVPLPFFSPATFRSVVASFLTVFPQSTLWYNTSELLLIGANTEHFEIDPARLAILGSNERVHQDLAFSPWGGPGHWLHHPAVFLGGLLSGPRDLARLAAGSPVFRDDRPDLEYAALHASARQTRELPSVELLRRYRTPLADIGVPDQPSGLAASADRIRERNIADIGVEALLRQVEALPEDDPRRIELLADAVERNPESIRAHLEMGEAWLLQQRFDEARRSFSIVLEIDPNEGPAHRGMGVAFHREKRVPEALEHYLAAIRIDSTDAEAHNNAGVALASRGDFSEALVHFERAVALRPEWTSARENVDRIRAQMAAPRPSPPAP